MVDCLVMVVAVVAGCCCNGCCSGISWLNFACFDAKVTDELARNFADVPMLKGPTNWPAISSMS